MGGSETNQERERGRAEKGTEDRGTDEEGQREKGRKSETLRGPEGSVSWCSLNRLCRRADRYLEQALRACRQVP
jgi:hypothetical protein